MSLKHVEEYRDPALGRALAERIRRASTRRVRLMEVCGTHTVAIFRSGIRSLLPDTLSLLSGPGCPVCVTTQREIDAFVALSRRSDVIFTTFGDLMRVPGTVSSLQQERAAGCDVRVVYSVLDALEIARNNPAKKVIFPGVGFETTAPTIASALLSAREQGLGNFLVYSAHKLVPPALSALMSAPEAAIDGFILPGHVSVIIGRGGYCEFFERYRVPSVIAGFEPVDLLRAIGRLVEQIEGGGAELENAYGRAVTEEGSPIARRILNQVFRPVDAAWRGIGVIPRSGLRIAEEFSGHDAEQTFELELPDAQEPRGCSCGEILLGAKIPPQCALYKTACTPVEPVGPCMVSSEGTCAAYYRYYDRP